MAAPNWELKVIDVVAEAEYDRAHDMKRKPKDRVLNPKTIRALYYADVVAPGIFESYSTICNVPEWNPDYIRNEIFTPGNTTHIIELYDTADKQLKAFAFLHAPSPPPSKDYHAKCVLACGVSGKVWNVDGKSAMKIVQAKREEIANKNGYEFLDLTAGNRDPLVGIWGTYGFKELPGQEGKVKDIKMEKSLPPPPTTGARRRKTRKRITRKKRTRRNVA